MKEEFFENEDDFSPLNGEEEETNYSSSDEEIYQDEVDDFETAESEEDENGDDLHQTDLKQSEQDKSEEEAEEEKLVAVSERNSIAQIDVPSNEPDDEPEQKHVRIMPWVLCAVGAWLVLSFCFSDGFFATKYRENFKSNVSAIDQRLGVSKSMSKIFGSDVQDVLKKKEDNVAKGTTYDNESYLVPYELAGESTYTSFDGMLCVAKSNHIELFSDQGEVVWKSVTSVVNPIMSVEGKYIALAENGGTKINLFSDEKLIFSADAQNEILNVNVSSGGDVVVVTKKELYKGAVEVYNKDGEKVYGWVSGKDTIMCADISPSGRRLAVGFISTSEGVGSSVQLFNIKNESSYKTVEIPDTVICRLEYSGEKLSIMGDNRFIGLSTNGSVLWDKSYENRTLEKMCIKPSGEKGLLSEKENRPVIEMYSGGGRLKNEIFADDLPDYIDIYSNTVLYNDARMIIFGKSSKQKKYPASMDIKGLVATSAGSFAVIYNNSIEFFKS